MKDSPELFELIHSLSPNEKRYLSITISSESVNLAYYKLFKIIDSFEKYDEHKLHQAVKSESFAHRLPAVKHYLHQLILKNLRNFHSGSTVDIEMHESFIEVDILYQKRLLLQASKLLSKIEKHAEEREIFELLAYCYTWKKQINYEGIYSKNGVELIGLYKKQNDIARKLENLNQFKLLDDQINQFNFKNGIVRNKTDGKWIEKFLKNPLLKTKNKALSFSALNTFYSTRSTGFYLLQKFEQSLKNVNECLLLYRTRITFDKVLLSEYITISFNQVLLFIYLRDYKNTFAKLDDLEQLPNRAIREGWKYKINPATLFELECQCHHYSLIANIGFGKYQTSLQLISKMEKLILVSEFKVSERLLLLFHYLSAYNNFILGNYKQTLNYLNKILNYTKEDTLIREDIYAMAKLLYLITHYELKTSDLPSYLLKSTYRFLSKRNRIYGVEDALLSFIRNKLLKNTNPQLLNKNFTELKTRLEKITEKNYEKRILDYFDFIAWLDSKITRKSFLEIMKAKYNDREVPNV